MKSFISVPIFSQLHKNIFYIAISSYNTNKRIIKKLNLHTLQKLRNTQFVKMLLVFTELKMFPHFKRRLHQLLALTFSNFQFKRLTSVRYREINQIGKFHCQFIEIFFIERRQLRQCKKVSSITFYDIIHLSSLSFYTTSS